MNSEVPCGRPSLLVLSFSDIANDARVKKQVVQFADRYSVTTCGFGDQVVPEVPHIRLSEEESVWAGRLEAILLRARWYSAAYWRQGYVRQALRALRGSSFDAVIANDLEPAGIASKLYGASHVHADLHEYFPGLHDQVPAWVRLRQPFLKWQLGRFVSQVRSVTTVSDTIADRYELEFGFRSGVVRNASPELDLAPSQTGHPIRIVHSGGAQPNRRIEVMMKAVAESSADVTLDLFLTHETSPYASDLRALAERLGERISLHPPVKQSDLVMLLNTYDVGIHVLPPTNTNNALALPNKFFDFVQARLGMVIGPTADMVRLLEQHQLGTVAAGFDLHSVTAAVNELTVELVSIWKNNANQRAHELSAEQQQEPWEAAVEAITQGDVGNV